MRRSLKVSGELNAGVSITWERVEAYFPQDSASAAADIIPGTLADSASDYGQTYVVEPELDATLSAEGNLARINISSVLSGTS